MIANAQVVAFGLNGRINNLVVKELRRLWHAGNPPVVVIDEAPQERELTLLTQNLDLDEIAELPRECTSISGKSPVGALGPNGRESGVRSRDSPFAATPGRGLFDCVKRSIEWNRFTIFTCRNLRTLSNLKKGKLFITNVLCRAKAGT
jgi:hypothetical protein